MGGQGTPLFSFCFISYKEENMFYFAFLSFIFLTAIIEAESLPLKMKGHWVKLSC